MELSELKNRICDSFSGSMQDLQDVLAMVEEDNAIYPFNEFEHLICSLIEKGGLSYQQYIDIRTEYISENPNLWIFEISAPRGFGEKFAQTYVQGKCHKLQKPSKKIDPSFSGEYDLWLDGIRIEVKASRAVDSNSDEPLYIKALSRDTEKPFLMNFQQLKPQCCDVFIWVAVFRDQIVLWVMGSQDVLDHELYSKGQHRGNKGNEGQLHIKHDNVHLFRPFELATNDLETVIRRVSHNSAYQA
ncbi:MAG: hypothetical protein EBT20_18125 [Alphaproteobacteria bacterium]|nr:hypothetical protein [Alphaproteobacteria bacterium]